MRDTRRAVDAIRDSGAVAIVRVRAEIALLKTIEALRNGGLSCIEVTMNTPGVLETLEQAAVAFPELILGAGTVLDAASASAAVSAGAQFLVTPIMAPDVIGRAKEEGCAVICGAMTPTEIHTAWNLGADIVKVFPADVLGTAFFRAMRGPLPQIPLAPTGGISDETAGDYIREGAVAVCAGGWLVNDRLLAAADYAQIQARARALCQAVREARASMDVT
jgi:2-dehydro-3-deoxyphosphogluconate aldolase/(4S)-4-hydroxy-2-oxoglutarate aldolase